MNFLSLLFVHIWISVGKAVWRLLLRWQSGQVCGKKIIQCHPVRPVAESGRIRRAGQMHWMLEFSRSFARRVCVWMKLWLRSCGCVHVCWHSLKAVCICACVFV
ncbi:hypothetical protein QQF64_003337 [Cirrhinus molitorella]|uniref:Secreted protein n=1 Tax=Cirrhinus molitorella TaxID=172907 RepID=A0ABR3ML10_9TELE